MLLVSLQACRTLLDSNEQERGTRKKDEEQQASESEREGDSRRAA